MITPITSWLWSEDTRRGAVEVERTAPLWVTWTLVGLWSLVSALLVAAAVLAAVFADSPEIGIRLYVVTAGLLLSGFVMAVLLGAIEAYLGSIKALALVLGWLLVGPTVSMFALSPPNLPAALYGALIGITLVRGPALFAWLQRRRPVALWLCLGLLVLQLPMTLGSVAPCGLVAVGLGALLGLRRSTP